MVFFKKTQGQSCGMGSPSLSSLQLQFPLSSSGRHSLDVVCSAPVALALRPEKKEESSAVMAAKVNA